MPVRNTEADLELIAWQWAGVAMVDCKKLPGCWKAWLEHEKSLPAELTDSKVGKAFTEFVEKYKETQTWLA